MANTVIALKKSGTPSATPASLEFGELAINYADGVLYYKAANGSIYPFSSGGNAFATVNANGTLVVADTASDVFSLVPGNFINIVGDGINDSITISANVKVVYDTSNAAFDKANTSAKVTMSNTAPIGAGSGDFWWNSDLGRLFVYYNDGDTSQWVEATALLGPDYGLVYDVANAAFDKANTSVAAGLAIVYDATNAAFSTANSAFDKANNAIANTSNVIIYGDLRVTGTLNVGNSTTTITTNTVLANNITISENLIVKSVDIFATVNAAYTQANSTSSSSNAVFDAANAAFNKANSANLLAYNTGIGANAYASAVGVAANTVGSAAFDAANAAGSGATVTAAFAQANTANTTAKFAYDAANAAYINANTKLATTGGTISGDLSVAGNLTVTGNTTFVSAENLRVSDPLLYLAGNNYASDIVDIGFIANYVNGTGQNVHTGLYREHENKMYYLFQGYDKEPINNHLGALSNNMTLAVLNADLVTSNLNLAGANAVDWIRSTQTTSNASFAQANTANTTAKFAYDKANAGSNVTFTQFVIKGGGNVNIIYANSNSSSFNIETGNGVTYSNTANGINLGLTTTGVTAGYYGANNVIPIIDVDQFGRVRSIINVAAQAASVNGTVIINNTVGNQKLANVSQGTVKGRANTGTGEVEDLTFTQFVNSLPTFTTTNRGVVPATGPLANNFLRDDATWQPVLPNTSATLAGNLTLTGNIFSNPTTNTLTFTGYNFAFGANTIPQDYSPDYITLTIGGKSPTINGAGDIVFLDKYGNYKSDFYYDESANTMRILTGSGTDLTLDIGAGGNVIIKTPSSPLAYFYSNDYVWFSAEVDAVDYKARVYGDNFWVGYMSRLASQTANAAWDKANNANILAFRANVNAIAAFAQANTAYTVGNSAFIFANTANALAYQANINAVAAFVQANVSLNVAQAAFAKANSVSAGGISLNAQNTAPTGVANNLWFNTDTGEMFVYFTDWDGTSQWTQINGGSGGGAFKNIEYYHMFFYPGFVDSNVTMYLNMSPTNYTLPANLVGSYARVGTAPSGNGANLRIMRNDAFVGNISFARNNTNGTFIFANTLTFAPGDVFKIMSPTVFDSAMSDIAITLLGSKN